MPLNLRRVVAQFPVFPDDAAPIIRYGRSRKVDITKKSRKIYRYGLMFGEVADINGQGIYLLGSSQIMLLP